MTRTTTSRPRMAAIYAPGTVRARRWHGDGDVRGYRPPSGWTACADLTDIHPITGRALPRAVVGDSPTRRNEQPALAPSRSAALGRWIPQKPGAAVAAPGFNIRGNCHAAPCELIV